MLSDRIHIDDATGRQIASPEDARNGGSIMLKGPAAEAWLKEHPDLALKELPKVANKAVPLPESKALKAS